MKRLENPTGTTTTIAPVDPVSNFHFQIELQTNKRQGWIPIKIQQGKRVSKTYQGM
jgi:hypothetical protein